MPLVNYGGITPVQYGSGGDGAGNLMNIIRYRARMVMLEENVPELGIVSPQTVQNLAIGNLPDGDMMRAAFGAMGENMLQKTAHDLSRLDPFEQRANFSAFHPAKQNLLMEIGYQVPNEEAAQAGRSSNDGGFFGLPGLKQATGLLDAATPGFIDDALGKAASTTGHVLGTALSPLKPVVSTAFHWLGSGERLISHIGRVGTELDERTTWHSPLIELGGFAHLITNPSQFHEIWETTSDGEEYINPAKIEQAAGMLNLEAGNAVDLFRRNIPGPVNLDLAVGQEVPLDTSPLDPASQLYIARKAVGGHGVEEIFDLLGLTDSVDDIPKKEAVYKFLESDTFEEVLTVLDSGKTSFGREMARNVGMEPGDAGHALVSGAFDGAAIIMADPFLALGRLNKTRRAFKWGVHTQDGVTVSNLHRVASAVRAGDDVVDGFRIGVQDRLEATAVNRAVERINTAFTVIKNGTKAEGRQAATALLRDMPQLQGALHSMVKVNRWGSKVSEASKLTLRKRGWDLFDLSDYDEVWRFYASQAGQRSIVTTRMGGIIPEYTLLPRISRAGQARIWAKTKAYKGIFDPAPNVPKEFMENMDEMFGELLGARNTGYFDELMNWQSTVRASSTLTNKLTRPVRGFVHAFAHHVPRTTRLYPSQKDAIEEFSRVAEFGALAWMPRSVIDDYVGAFILGAPNERHLIHNQMLREIAVRSGLIDGTDEAAELFINKFIRHSEWAFSVKGNDIIRFRKGLMRTGTIIDDAARTHQSDVLMMPDFRTLRNATRRVNIYRRINGGINPQMVEGIVQKAWKPAQLMRISFIPRAAGEELLAFVLRRTSLEYLDAKAALAAAGGKQLRYQDDLGNFTLVPTEDFRELALLRPFMYFRHNVRKMAGYTDAQVRRKAEEAVLNTREGRALTDELFERRVSREARRIRDRSKFYARDDREVFARSLSHRLADTLHEQAQSIGMWTKADLNKRWLQWRHGDLAEDQIYVARIMLTDPTHARAFARLAGDTWSPFVSEGLQSAGIGTANVREIGSPGNRVIVTRTDLSNNQYYTHDELDMYYHSATAATERIANSRTSMPAVHELKHQLGVENRAEIKLLAHEFLRSEGDDVVSILGEIRRVYDELPEVSKDMLLRWFDEMNPEYMERAMAPMHENHRAIYQHLLDLQEAGKLSADYAVLFVDRTFDVAKVTSSYSALRPRAYNAAYVRSHKPDMIGSVTQDVRMALDNGDYLMYPMAEDMVRLYVPMINKAEFGAIVRAYEDPVAAERMRESIERVLTTPSLQTRRDKLTMEDAYDDIVEMLAPASNPRNRMATDDLVRTAEWRNMNGQDHVPASFISSTNPDDADIILDILGDYLWRDPSARKLIPGTSIGMPDTDAVMRTQRWVDQVPELPAGVPNIPTEYIDEVEAVLEASSPFLSKKWTLDELAEIAGSGRDPADIANLRKSFQDIVDGKNKGFHRVKVGSLPDKYEDGVKVATGADVYISVSAAKPNARLSLSRGSITINWRAVQEMDRPELQALFAHEYGHWLARDILPEYKGNEWLWEYTADQLVPDRLRPHMRRELFSRNTASSATHPSSQTRAGALARGANRRFTEYGPDDTLGRGLSGGSEHPNPFGQRTTGRLGFQDMHIEELKYADGKDAFSIFTQEGRTVNNTRYFQMASETATDVEVLLPTKTHLQIQVRVPDPDDPGEMVSQWWSSERMNEWIKENQDKLDAGTLEKPEILNTIYSNGLTEEAGIRQASIAHVDTIMETLVRDPDQRNHIGLLHQLERHHSGDWSFDVDQLLNKATLDNLPKRSYGPVRITVNDTKWEQIVREWFQGQVSPAVEAIIRRPMYHQNLVIAKRQTQMFYDAAIDDDLDEGALVLLNLLDLRSDDFDDITTTVWNAVQSGDDRFLFDTNEVSVDFVRKMQTADDAGQIRNAFITAEYVPRDLAKQLSDNDWMQLQGWMRMKHGAWANQNEAMINRAMELTIPYIDDHRIRSQFQEHVGGLIPFWYAEEQFLKRWARGIYESPELLRKAQLILNGFREMGIIKDDGQGHEYLVWPGSAELMDVVGNVIKPVFGEEAAFVVQNPLTTRTDFLLPGLRPDVGRMEFGPLPAFSLNQLATRYPEVGNLRDAVLGDMGSNRFELHQYAFPSWVIRFIEATPGINIPTGSADKKSLASAQQEAIQYLAANDMLPDEDAGPLAREEFLDRVRSTARIILVMRAITGFTLPSTANPTNIGEYMELDLEFKELLATGIPYPEALRMYLEVHPDATAMTVFSSTTASGAPIPATADTLAFMEDHGELLDTFPTAGPWLLPQSDSSGRFGIKERRAQAEALTRELRIRRTPEEFLEQMYFAQAVETFTDANREYRIAKLQYADDPTIKAQLDENWRTFSNAYKEQHPVFATMFSDRGSAARRADTIDELSRLVSSPEILPDVPHKDDFVEMANLVLKYEDMLNAMRYATGAQAINLREQLDTQLYNQAYALQQRNPALSAFFSSIVLNVIGQNDVLKMTFTGA